MHNHYVSDFLIMLVIFHGSMSNNNKSRDWLDDSKWACRFHHSGSDQFRLTHFQYPQNPENVSIFPENFFVSIFEISRNLVKCVNLSGTTVYDLMDFNGERLYINDSSLEFLDWYSTQIDDPESK